MPVNHVAGKSTKPAFQVVNTALPMCSIQQLRYSRGFSLIELVIGMLVFAVAMVSLTNVFSPQVRNGIEPIWQTRAVNLAKSLANEIQAKAFDENSILGALNQPCGGTTNCTQSGSLGPETGETRDLFDDVDDFNGLVLQGSDIASSLGESASFGGVDVYAGFQAQIFVVYDDNADGINDDDINQDDSLDTGTLVGNRKLVRIVVRTPADEDIVFSLFRDNY